jgi:hypothetical protein
VAAARRKTEIARENIFRADAKFLEAFARRGVGMTFV